MIGRVPDAVRGARSVECRSAGGLRAQARHGRPRTDADGEGADHDAHPSAFGVRSGSRTCSPTRSAVSRPQARAVDEERRGVIGGTVAPPLGVHAIAGIALRPSTRDKPDNATAVADGPILIMAQPVAKLLGRRRRVLIAPRDDANRCKSCHLGVTRSPRGLLPRRFQHRGLLSGARPGLLIHG